MKPSLVDFREGFNAVLRNMAEWVTVGNHQHPCRCHLSSSHRPRLSLEWQNMVVAFRASFTVYHDCHSWWLVSYSPKRHALFHRDSSDGKPLFGTNYGTTLTSCCQCPRPKHPRQQPSRPKHPSSNSNPSPSASSMLRGCPCVQPLLLM